jgi:hypothetical protein
LLHFVVGPEATILEDVTYVTYGNDLTIRCDFEGFPVPSNVTWKKDGEFDLNSRTSVTLSLFGRGGASFLTIMDVVLEDSGVYACTSSVDGSNITASDNITAIVVCELAPTSLYPSLLLEMWLRAISSFLLLPTIPLHTSYILFFRQL